jgi:hypothetical protein
MHEKKREDLHTRNTKTKKIKEEKAWKIKTHTSKKENKIERKTKKISK